MSNNENLLFSLCIINSNNADEIERILVFLKSAPELFLCESYRHTEIQVKSNNIRK